MCAKLCALVVAAGLSLAVQQEAQARDLFKSFVIRNPSNADVNYQVKWGDGEWKSYRVEPGETRWHYVELDGDGPAPGAQVRFDWICGDGEVTYRLYTVQTEITDVPRYGKRHVFRHSDNGRFLDLHQE